MELPDHILNVKILIVDDQKIHVLLLEEIFHASGYKNIRSTTDPLQAVGLYQEFQPDLLILDLQMPQCDGFEVMKQLKAVKKDDYLPILVLSSQKGQEINLHALEAGATDFLDKPYENIEVLVRVRNMIEVRLLHNQVRDQNRILEAKVRERTQELQDTRLDIIHRLARAAEFRDNETGIHIIRMSKYSALLGSAVGMNETQCELLLNASPLHDIGKIGIPDSILLKPGQLTQEEWDIMKTHTTLGAELLSGSNAAIMKMAEVIAFTHHERWDGSGYPRGLKGEDIPLVGRITGLCDVFDALTSKRPYKRAWTPEEAMTEIKKQSGKHFDPHLVEAFIRILSEVQRIKDSCVD